MLKKILFALAAVVLLAGIVWSVVLGVHNQDTAKDSVVRLYCRDEIMCRLSGSSSTEKNGVTSTGSAVAVGNDKNGNVYLVTNRHCIETTRKDLDDLFYGYGLEFDVLTSDTNGQGIYADEVYVVLTNLNNKIAATIVAVSERTDLAILRTTEPIPALKPIGIRAFDTLGSETLYTLGFPSIADQMDKSGIDVQGGKNFMTLSNGMVGRVAPHDETRAGEMIQMNADIYHGNSGGALVDNHGKLLGINTLGISGGTSNVNYAVSSNEVVRLCNTENIPIHLTKAFGTELAIILGAAIALASALCLAALLGGKKKKAVPGDNHQKDDVKKTRPAAVWQLRGTKGVYANQEITISSRLSIGRAASNDLRYPEGTNGVSSNHCVLTVRADGVMVQDSSTYGTYVNGVKVVGTQTMRAGDRISLGSEKEAFVLHQN